MKDYYGILGVSHQATSTEIKRAYRRLAILYHPDKNSSPQAENLFKEINEANDVLADAEKRRLYDYKFSNPLTESIQTDDAQPVHRDPRYRGRRPANYPQQEPKPNNYQLMKEYLPYFRWLNWPGLAIMFILAVDFILPVKNSEERIMEVYGVYGGKWNSHLYDIVETTVHKIRLYDSEASRFRNEQTIIVKYTPILSSVLEIENPSNQFTASVGGIYSPVLAVPILLFITSVLGILFRNNVEYAFNFSIGNGVLLIFVLYLVLRI